MARRSARLAKKKKQDAIADQDEEIRYSAAHRALAIPEILAEIMSHYVEHDRLLVPTFTAYQLVNRAWLKSLDRMVVASIGIFAGMGAIIHTYTSFRVSVRQMHLAGGFSAVKTLYTRASGYAYETTLIRDVATILPLCSNMTTLNICGNDLAALASLLPGSLATYLPKLKRLSCEAMFCTGSTVAFLSGFSRLTHLHIVNNWILGRPILPWDGLSTLFQVLGAHITYLEIGKVASNAVAEVLWNACSRLPCLLATKVRGYHLPAGFLLGLPQRLQRMEAECDPASVVEVLTMLADGNQLDVHCQAPTLSLFYGWNHPDTYKNGSITPELVQRAIDGWEGRTKRTVPIHIRQGWFKCVITNA